MVGASLMRVPVIRASMAAPGRPPLWVLAPVRLLRQQRL